MYPFKPKSPNPSIRKSSDATPAVIGQLNEVVAGKTDVQNFTTGLFSSPPFIITPSMIKLNDTITINDGMVPPGNNVLKTYKIKGIVLVEESANYANYYLGSIEWKDACDFDIDSSWSGTVTSYDYDSNDGSQYVNSFGIGALIADSDSSDVFPLTIGHIYLSYYTYTWDNVDYSGFDAYINMEADAATYMQCEVAFEMEFLYNDFCDKNLNPTFYP